MQKSRLFIVVLLLLGMWSLMLLRGAYLQFHPELPLNEIKEKQFSRMIRLSPRRGDILDREGRELAASVSAYSLFADPALIEKPHQVARKLASILGLKPSEVYRKLKDRQRRFIWIQRRLDRSVYQRVLALQIRGLGFKEEFKRVYPAHSLAAPLLGYVGREQQGLAGLELRYNDLLTGAGTQMQVQRDARGRALVKDGHVFASSPVGGDLVLTIDKDLQFWVESQLQAAVEAHQAEAAWAVVLNPEDGEILAMANAPSFDANRALSFPADRRRNRSVQDVYETGSVMKAFTIAGALRAGLVEPNTKINTENGQFKIGKRVIREADKKHAFKELTVSDILAHSSNVGTSKIALKMKDQLLYQTLLDFGFKKTTGADLPGEGKGLLIPPPWRDHLLANISFGHGVAVTALQVANAYAAIANGGLLHQPSVVREIRDPQTGEVHRPVQPEPRRVLSVKEASLMKMMLSSVVQEGRSGAFARVDGFPVAGKTGTAQKVDPKGRGYLPGHYISSFAGFVPANDPKYVIYIAVDSPKKKDYYASTVAAPIFRDIAQFALRRDRALPVYLSRGEQIRALPDYELKLSDKGERAEPRSYPINRIPATTEVFNQVPNLKGLTLHQVLKQMNGQPFELAIRGQGRVARVSPEQGDPVRPQQKIQIELQPSSGNSVE